MYTNLSSQENWEGLLEIQEGPVLSTEQKLESKMHQTVARNLMLKEGMEVKIYRRF